MTVAAAVTATTAGTGWRGALTLDYHRRGARTVGQDTHTGPLRVLQPLYPEGEGICHHVLVHPPGGLVGGDELHITARLQPGSHALLTTPGATRFYRSEGAPALQHTRLQLADGARLEWLPMETIAYSGCLAQSRLIADLAPGAECLGWDALTLGLAAAGQPFVAGSVLQHIELPGVWIERARIAADDTLLLAGPLGWAGQRVAATLWFAAGSALAPARRQALLDAAREVVAAHPLAATAGVTAPQPSVLVLRLLAPRLEPAMQLLAQVRAAWRSEAWGLAAQPPRIWRT
ncbi:MAG: urease accessory protein UreD [Rubrivivax sp.]|nr:urease accessory protein UreD [Rubrivivax sp.]